MIDNVFLMANLYIHERYRNEKMGPYSREHKSLRQKTQKITIIQIVMEQMPQKRQRNEELRDSPETKRLPRREGLCVIPSTEGVCREIQWKTENMTTC